jgi:predicted solute-binding protein
VIAGVDVESVVPVTFLASSESREAAAAPTSSASIAKDLVESVAEFRVASFSRTLTLTTNDPAAARIAMSLSGSSRR